MIPPLSSPFQRGALVAVSFVIGASLAYFSIRNAFAVHFAALQTREGCERAVHLEPGDTRNWHLLGRLWQFNLQNRDGPRAIRAYLAALSLNPGSADIWLDLATVYESEGNLAAARDAFLHARRAYPLSAEGSWRYGNFLLRQGELDPAFTELRRAVESDPKRGAETFSRSLNAGSSVETILNRVLPPISSAYVDVIRDQIADGHTEIALSVWDRLASIHTRLPLQDSFPLVGTLMTEKPIAHTRHLSDQALYTSH